MTVFNESNTEWKDGSYQLFMGQQPALHDTINVAYPTILNLALRQVSQRWQFDEFNHEQSRLDLLACPQSVYQIMLMNIAYQWPADSMASRAIATVFAPYVTNSELWEALLENTNMEVTHAKTYSDIVRQCVPNPKEVFQMVMESEATLARASTVNKVFDNLAANGREYAGGNGNNLLHYSGVFMGVVALLALERIQFMTSFAATFAIVDQGYFQSIGKAVQKIMLDELDCHAALDMEILRIEMLTPRGKLAVNYGRAAIKALLDEVVAKELSFAAHLFSEGRAIVGYNEALATDWARWNAQPVYDFLGVAFDWERITKSPLPWMDDWLDINKTQNAQQEGDGNNYAMNVVKDDLGSDIIDY